MRLTVDTLPLLHRAAAALQHHLDLRLPHPRGRLDAPPRSSPSRSPTASPTSQAAVAAGLEVDAFARRLSFFFNAHNDVFQEVAKFRAARLLVGRDHARALRRARRALADAALPRPDRRLDADRPAGREQHRAGRPAGLLRGLRRQPRACTPTASTRRWRCPPSAARRSPCAPSRSWPAEAGATDTADPFGGCYYVEALTDALDAQARTLIAEIDELGGAVAAIEAGWVQDQIEQAAFAHHPRVQSGETGDRGCQPVDRPRARSRWSCSASTRPPSGEQIDRVGGCPRPPRRGRRRVCAGRGAGGRGGRCQPARSASVRRCVRLAPSARCATCCGPRGAPTTPSAPVRKRTRIGARPQTESLHTDGAPGRSDTVPLGLRRPPPRVRRESLRDVR